MTASRWRTAASPSFLPAPRLEELIGALRADGRRVVGPVVEDGALKMAEIEHAAELPFGWTATSAPGLVRLEQRRAGDPGVGRAFDNGPAWSGIKPWTFPSRVDALSVETRDDGSLAVRVESPGCPANGDHRRPCVRPRRAWHP